MSCQAAVNSWSTALASMTICWLPPLLGDWVAYNKVDNQGELVGPAFS